MKMREALPRRPSVEARRDTEAATNAPEEHPVPISDYGQLGDTQVSDQLAQLSQVELAAVEADERAHGSRPVVLDKLRYMQGTRTLPGCDTLTTEQIAEALAGADAERSGPCGTTSASSRIASQCCRKPHAYCRPRGRPHERNARVRTKPRSSARATRIESEPRPTHRSNAPVIEGRLS
jgi:hypothetical protein